MSTYDPSGLAVMSKNNGDILYAENLKELVNLEKGQFNGKIGNVNISSLPGEKIAYSKLDLDGSVVDGDIVSVSVTKFSSLKATAQTSPNNTVQVAAGNYSATDAKSTKVFAGGNSPAFAAVVGVGNARIDVLVIDDAGTLSIVSGVEAVSPVAPDYPNDKIAICEVYVRYNLGGVIKDTDDTVNAYIKLDARAFIKNPGLVAGSVGYDTIAQGGAAGFRDIKVGTDIGDPGTSFVTMTNMERTFASPLSFQGYLVHFQAPITIRQAAANFFPAAEIRLMVSVDGGAYSEVVRTMLDFQNDVAVGAGDFERTIPVSLVGFHANGVAPTSTAFKIEWRRVGALGTPTIEQRGAAIAHRQLMFIGLNKPSLMI